MEKRDSIKDLYTKFLDNSITEAEYHQLLAHFGSDRSDEQLQNIILHTLESDEEAEIHLMYSEQIGDTVSSIKNKLHTTVYAAAPKRKRLVIRFMPYIAAALVLILGTVSYLFLMQPDTQSLPVVEVAPGGNRAVLKLANGEEIALSEQQEGILNKDGLISYTDGTAIRSEANMQMLTLTTPAGGQYQIFLPDGTKAWLNSLSSVTYPSSFAGNERRILITGEVYLDVAKDATKKFVVEANRQEIEVLGTRFNINTYADDGNLYTTLEEGSLRVTDKVDGKSVRLKPGEQAVVSEDRDIELKQIDVNEVISWKDGFYFIQDQPLSLFSKQIERWYNVKMDMGTKGNLRLSAMIPKDANLSEVLQAIELKTGVKFIKEGRGIKVQE